MSSFFFLSSTFLPLSLTHSIISLALSSSRSLYLSICFSLSLAPFLQTMRSSCLVNDHGRPRHESLALVVAAEEVAVVHLHDQRQDVPPAEAQVAVVRRHAVVERLHQSIPTWVNLLAPHVSRGWPTAAARHTYAVHRTCHWHCWSCLRCSAHDLVLKRHDRWPG